MAKSSGLDDIAKIIFKAMRNKGSQKARYTISKQAGVLGKKFPSSPYPKEGPKIGRIAKTPPRRPTPAKYPKGKNIAQTPSEQMAVERQANRILRKSGGNTGSVRGSGKDKAVDVRSSVINPPTKATLRQPKPSNKSYEADPTRRFEKTPKKPKPAAKKPNQPKGTKPSQGTKKSKGGTTQSSSVKPKANMSVGKGKGQVQRQSKKDAERDKSGWIQFNINKNNAMNNQRKLNELNKAVENAKTPAAKKKAIAAVQAHTRMMMNRKLK
jgi:hypothetical protein